MIYDKYINDKFSSIWGSSDFTVNLQTDADIEIGSIELLEGD